MKQLFSLVFIFFSISIFSQSILVFHKTNGFRHTGAINAGITMFNNFGANNGFTVTNSQNSNVFTANNLAQYDAVVFLNTSGNNLLSTSERAAFENFIASGKGFVGIHAATDTYRDGSWDFYNQLVGGIVQTSPNHTNNNFNADMEVITSNPIIDFLGPVTSIWNKNEEYYYWQNNGGQLSTDNTVLLEVEQTIGPNGNVNSYDAARPITWFKESVTYDDDDDNNTPDITMSGIRSFYTALGHNGSDYSNNSNFRDMLENATLWAIGNTLSVEEQIVSEFKIAPNPVKTTTNIQFKNSTGTIKIALYNVIGQQVLAKTIDPLTLNNNSYSLDMSQLNNGIYLLKMASNKLQKSLKLVKI